MHDASETCMRDRRGRQLEQHHAEYRTLEAKWMAAVDTALQLGGRVARYLSSVKEVDNRMLFTERRDLMPGVRGQMVVEKGAVPQAIIPWGSAAR